MNRILVILFLVSMNVFGGNFPPFVESALEENGCEDFERFNEINETDEYPFQYGYGDPETVIVWCRWRDEGQLLILPRKNSDQTSDCPDEVKSKYILPGGLTLVEKTIALSNFNILSNNFPLEDTGETEGIIIHSNWAGAGTYLYCHKGEWVYFNHD